MISVGLIGYGYWGPNMARNIQENNNMKLSIICDSNIYRLKRATQRYPHVRCKDNIKEIHHRQPVVLNQTDISRYLNIELQGSAFLKERKIPDLIFHKVSKDVNKPINIVLHWSNQFKMVSI